MLATGFRRAGVFVEQRRIDADLFRDEGEHRRGRRRSRAVVAARLGSVGNRKARPIWALQDAGSDERCRGWSWTSETDRHSRRRMRLPGLMRCRS
jgi:hypothetical protein